MGTLAIDIETASPNEEPPKGEYENTEYFELVAIALGFRPDRNSPVESDVLFRKGDWKCENTAKLLGRLLDWTTKREIDDVLTYNGTGFDFIHLRNWTESADETGLSDGALERIEALASKQTDLKYPAIENHSDLINSGHEFPKFEKVCQARSVSTTETKYADYDISSDFLQDLGAAETVQGWHIGKYLGEQYIEGVTNGLEDTLTYRELETMLADYAKADVRPLFDLYESFDVSDTPHIPD